MDKEDVVNIHSGILLIKQYTSKENENTNSKVCTPVFIAALFTITKMLKQPKCPSIDEWIKQM